MQQKHAESTPSAKPTTAQPSSKRQGPHLLARMCSELKRYKPLARWVVLSLLMLSVMRSAANYFFPSSPSKVADSKLKNKEKNGSVYHIPSWWNPESTLADSSAASDDTAGPTPSTSTSTTSTNTPGKTGASSSFGSNQGSLPTLPIGNGPSVSSAPAIGTILKGLPSMPNGFGAQAQPSASGKSSFKFSAFHSKSSSSLGNSVVPVDHGTQLSSSPLLGTNKLGFTLPGSLSSKPMYAVLGLSNSGTPSSSSDDAEVDGGLVKTSSGDLSSADLSFSLSGSLSATPTYTFSDVPTSGPDGTTIVIASIVPEPGTGAMLIAGLGSLAMSRRRRRG